MPSRKHDAEGRLRHEDHALLIEHADRMRDDETAAAFDLPGFRRMPALRADLEFVHGPNWAGRLRADDATRRYRDRLREVCFDWPGGFVAHGIGYAPVGENSPSAGPPARECLLAGLACNDARITDDGDGVVGDPTEGALVVGAAKAGIGEAPERLDTIPFSSERQYMGDAPAPRSPRRRPTSSSPTTTSPPSRPPSRRAAASSTTW